MSFKFRLDSGCAFCPSFVIRINLLHRLYLDYSQNEGGFGRLAGDIFTAFLNNVPLRADQRLIIFKEDGIQFKNIVILRQDKIFNDDVELTAMRQRIPCFGD